MKTNKRFKNIISTLAITALILTGSAPFFAFAEDGEGDAEVEVAPSATYDDSRVPATNGGAVILMNAENGDVIYEKNAHQLREPASVTKILTCLLAVENLDMDEVLTVPKDVESAGTSIDLEPGEELTVEQLLYGMMLESGNDAAQVLGIAVGGDLKHFSKMMNRRAKECGALDSVYKNPNGLNENADTLNVTTVYDQAVITRQALKNEDFRKVVSTVKYTIPKTNKSKARKLKNSNACLWDTKRTAPVNGKNVHLKYDGCTGVKTGFTTAAGGCYVGSAKKDDMELIVVSFGSMGVESKYADAIALWNYGFKYYKTYTALKVEGPLLKQKVEGGSLSKVEVGLPEDFDITLDKDYKDEDQITTEIELNSEEPAAPIKKGAVMGTVKAYDKDGTLIAVRDLLALEEVKEGGALSKIGIADEHAWIFIVAIVLVIVIALLLYIRYRRQHPVKRVQRPKRERPQAAEAEVETAEEQTPEAFEMPHEAFEIPQSAFRAERPQSETSFERPRMTSAKIEEPLSISRAEKPARPEPAEKPEYSPRGSRTKAEKRAIRKERARKRKERMKEREDVRH